MKSKLNIPRHSSIDHRKSPSLVSISNFENLNNSARKTSDAVPDSLLQNHLIATNKKLEYTGSGLMRVQSQTPTGSTPKNMFLINRRLTKGYLKFLEDKEWIDKREGERQKIEENVKKTLNNENPTMSKDIQKLISSTILNDPAKRPKSVLRVLENNSNSTATVHHVEEIHKQIRTRILGGDFENNLLFMKVQEEAVHGPHNLKEKSAHSEYRTKPSSVTSLKKQAEQVGSIPIKRVNRKSLVNSLAWSLNNLSEKKREKEEKLVSNGLVEKARSMNVLPPDPIQIIDAATSLNELEFSQNASSRRCENELEVKGQKGKGKRRGIDGSEGTGSQGNLKVRLTLKRKNDQSEYFSDLSNSKNQKGNAQVKKSAPNSVFLTGGEHGEVKSNYESVVNSRVLDNYEKETMDNINKLCSGAIKSTNKLGVKLRRQQKKIGKDFTKLDTQMERLNYENTIKNWEKSVKQVENIGQKSSFFNLVL